MIYLGVIEKILLACITIPLIIYLFLLLREQPKVKVYEAGSVEIKEKEK